MVRWTRLLVDAPNSLQRQDDDRDYLLGREDHAFQDARQNVL